jgi:hypothetical protein
MRWDEATRDVAPLVADRTCVVVVGELDDDAAHVALALAHAHIRTRRVAIVDAVGELAPLQKLLSRDARAHGVIDHFLHGVSLRKIAQPVNREGTLFILPSGAGPFEYDTLLRRERWRRMTMAFRGEGALLCIVLPRDAEGLAPFVEDTDGIVLVGDVEYPEPRHVIARVPRVGRMSADAGIVPAATAPAARFLSRVTRQARSKRGVVLAGGVFALLAVGALFAWDRGGDAADRDDQAGAVSASAQLAGTVVAADEGDSARAALYSVDILMLSSVTDASRHLNDASGGDVLARASRGGQLPVVSVARRGLARPARGRFRADGAARRRRARNGLWVGAAHALCRASRRQHHVQWGGDAGGGAASAGVPRLRAWT